MDAQLILFLAISAVVIITPGQDTALTIRNAMAGGKAAGIATATGVAAGQLLWATSAALGLVAILAATETVFTVIKYAGAAYLVYLGLQSLWSALSGNALNDHDGAATIPRRLAASKAFIQGVASNLGNPKMAIFFASLLPQFVAQDAAGFTAMMALGIVFCTMTFLWLCFYAYFVAIAGNVLRRPRIRKIIDSVTGVALVGLGIRICLVEK